MLRSSGPRQPALPSSGTRQRALRETVPVFAALGDLTRLELVERLSTSGPTSVGRLASGTRVSRQAVAKHLHVLASANLAHSERFGREIIWQLDSRPLDEARDCMELISSQWDDALNRLKLFVEAEESNESDDA